jgi:uncharacterized membrane protein
MTKPTRAQRYFELLSITLAMGALFYFIFYYPQLPAELPVHFDLEGNADRYGSKILLGIVPVLNVLVVIGFQFLSKKPQYLNYPISKTAENSQQLELLGQQLLRTMGLLIALLLGYITFATTNNGLGRSQGLNPTTMVVLGLAIVVILLYYIRKMMRLK